jgi:cytochrome oxidase Cu insertion factor (SCO1/SenC/PrrC family)
MIAQGCKKPGAGADGRYNFAKIKEKKMPRPQTTFQVFACAMLLTSFTLSACSPAAAPAVPAAVPATSTSTAIATAAPASARPDWFSIKLTDVQTGQTFTVNDFAGKVVLIQTMAQWCPTCLTQQNEVERLRQQLGNAEDLIVISLDVDPNEDETSLKNYAREWGFDWRFAIASLDVTRALGNLYSAQYLNPPLAPMLLIDREGNAYSLPFGKKTAEALQKTLAPYLGR